MRFRIVSGFILWVLIAWTASGAATFEPWHAIFQVVGPIASEKAPGRWRPWFEPRYEPLPLDGSATIPDELVVDGIRETPRSFDYEGQELDFEQLWHTTSGRGIVYFFKEEAVPAAGLLQVQCRAVGWVKWWVNGRLAYSWGGDGDQWHDHLVQLPLDKGENVICMRLAAGAGGWKLQMNRSPSVQTTPIGFEGGPIQIQMEDIEQVWSPVGFDEFAQFEKGLRAKAPSHRSATAVLGEESDDPDRWVRLRIKPLIVDGFSTDFFIQIKDGCELGFTSNYDADEQKQQVIWQIRVDGRSVWEVDHYVVKDWAGISPLADARQISQTRESKALDLDSSLGDRVGETNEIELIIASRGDELTLRTNHGAEDIGYRATGKAMEGLVLRKKIDGVGDRVGKVGLSLRGLEIKIENFNAQPLPDSIKQTWALCDNPPIRLGVVPRDPRRPDGGYPVMEGLTVQSLYRPKPWEWTFNHGARIFHANDRFYAIWSNNYMHEPGIGSRVLGTSSTDGKTWLPAYIVFPSMGGNVSDKMDNVFMEGMGVGVPEASPFMEVNGRIYAIGIVSARNFKGHDGELGMLAREVTEPEKPGPIFWIADRVPPLGEQYPAFVQLGEPHIAEDVAAILKDLNLEQAPGAIRYADLRSAVRGENPLAADGGIIDHDPIYTCRDGAQIRIFRNYNGTHRLYASARKSEDEEWGLAIPTNIPDSPSGVAVGELPDGQVYLIGNQIAGELDDPDARPYRHAGKLWPFAERDFQPEHFPRDPLTLAISQDGYLFDRIWAIRWDCPIPRHNALGWIPGYQYPHAIVVGETLWVICSVNKEDIEVMQIPIARVNEKVNGIVE